MNGKRKWLGLLTVFGMLLSLLFTGVVDAGCLGVFGGRQARRAARRGSYSVGYGYGSCGTQYAPQSTSYVQAPAKQQYQQAPSLQPVQAQQQVPSGKGGGYSESPPTRYGQRGAYQPNAPITPQQEAPPNTPPNVAPR